MQIRYLTVNHAVSPQITPEDVAAIAQEGFKKIVCNRPDSEVPPELQSAEIRQAAESHGLQFEVRPLTRDTLNAANATDQRQSVSEGGKTLAYCGSGTRSTMIWAIGEMGHRSEDDIIKTAAEAGYDLTPMWPMVVAASS